MFRIFSVSTIAALFASGGFAEGMVGADGILVLQGAGMASDTETSEADTSVGAPRQPVSVSVFHSGPVSPGWDDPCVRQQPVETIPGT